VQRSSDRRARSDGVQHANCPAKSYYFPATREAGLVQIAEALTEQCGHKPSRFLGSGRMTGKPEGTELLLVCRPSRHNQLVALCANGRKLLVRPELVT